MYIVGQALGLAVCQTMSETAQGVSEGGEAPPAEEKPEFQQKLKQAFDKIDTNGNGLLDKDELRAALGTMADGDKQSVEVLLAGITQKELTFEEVRSHGAMCTACRVPDLGALDRDSSVYVRAEDSP